MSVRIVIADGPGDSYDVRKRGAATDPYRPGDAADVPGGARTLLEGALEPWTGWACWCCGCSCARPETPRRDARDSGHCLTRRAG